MADDKKDKKEKKGFWAGLMEKLDKKMESMASCGCSCSEGDKKKGNKCC